MVFLANGLAAGGFFARLPEQQRRLDLTEGEVGLTVLGLAVGALVASPVIGKLVGRVGSQRVVVASGCALGAVWWLAGVAPRAWLLFAVLMAVGAADAAMDIAMNANAAGHQVGAGRSLLHGLHALWSLGMLAGAALGAAAAALEVPLSAHFAAIGAGVAVSVLVVGRDLPVDAPVPAEVGQDARPSRSPAVTRGLVVLGAASAGAAVLEGAPTDWSAIQLDQLGAGPGVAGLGVASFMAGMVLGRLLGDRLTDRFGGGAVLRAGLGLVAVGMGLAVALGSTGAYLVGVALAGAGASVFFPLAFSAAAHLPGSTTGAVAATVSLGGRVGFLVEPVVIGVVAEATSLRWALALVAVLALVLAVVAPRVVPV